MYDIFTRTFIRLGIREYCIEDYVTYGRNTTTLLILIIIIKNNTNNNENSNCTLDLHWSLVTNDNSKSLKQK